MSISITNLMLLILAALNVLTWLHAGPYLKQLPISYQKVRRYVTFIIVGGVLAKIVLDYRVSKINTVEILPVTDFQLLGFLLCFIVTVFGIVNIGLLLIIILKNDEIKEKIKVRLEQQ